MQQTNNHMFSTIHHVIRNTRVGLLAGLSLVIAPLAVTAATNTFHFSNTTVNAGSGPVNPANGVTAIVGTNLIAGDVVVFDGIVINVPGSTADAWGAVEMGAGGYLGLTSDVLGVLAETGKTSGNRWQLFVNGASTQFGSAALDAKTNRVHIELDCTLTGSTTNLTYLVEIDQGGTGTYNDSLSGTGLTFPNNTIPLAFGANNAAHLFIQTQPILAVSATSPATNLVAAGLSATFTATITQGYPIQTAQQWRSNGVPIPGATSLSYTTPPVTAAYNGAQYSVVVTNLLTAGNIVTSSPAVLLVRSAPGLVTFNFPTTTVAAGGGSVTDPGVAISGNGLLAGDTVVFDGIVTPNGSQLSDAWTAINIGGAGYGGVVNAKLGVLTRLGSGANPSQLFINGVGSSNPTPSSAATNRVRIELYPSATGSTTNMGWLVEIDQNLTGTFLPAVAGTNLTFTGNNLPLTFGSSGSSSFVYQNPQSPVSIFGGPSPTSQVVAVGAPISVGVTVEGWSPAFQWRKNGVAILNATNQNYTSPPATLADNGDQFTVVVSNRINSANVVTSTVARVSVLIPNNLTWYPEVDYTTWDVATANWTTNGGVSQAHFATGNNVTFDSLGYNVGGNSVNVTNLVNPNAVTINALDGVGYIMTGDSINGQSLLVTGDGTGSLYMAVTNENQYASVTITALPGSATTNTYLQIGYNGTDGFLQASFITNNGTLDFADAGLLPITATLAGSGTVIQDGAGTTVLSATNSTYTIQAINAGTLSIASTPNPGPILNNGVLVPASAATVLVIPNAISGSGLYDFTGFQTTVLTGVSSHTGQNQIVWSDVIVDNPAALGDPVNGSTVIGRGDNFGGLYLSNNIVWTQPLRLHTRFNTGLAASAPHIANFSGTNDITTGLTFTTGSAAGVNGTEFNVEATRGQLTIDAASSLVNLTSYAPVNLNLQGAGVGLWNGILTDASGGTALNVLKRDTGVWTLGGQNTYSGTTTVSGGTLLVEGQIGGTGNVTVAAGGTLGGSGSIAGAVTVAAGGTLRPGDGLGTLTVNANLTLSAGGTTAMEISKSASTNATITGLGTLTYGGTLVITNAGGTLTTSDAFPLFFATTYAGSFAAISPATPGAGLAWNTNTLTTDGTLRIVVGSTVNPNPTNITTSVHGNALTLSWPADHTGWRLQVQTKGLAAGLSSNTNYWATVPGSATTNSITITIISTNPAEFYRMVYP